MPRYVLQNVLIFADKKETTKAVESTTKKSKDECDCGFSFDDCFCDMPDFCEMCVYRKNFVDSAVKEIALDLPGKFLLKYGHKINFSFFL